ncbi:FAD/NAD(P)-binding domain-containing protein [Guyanagaster necrorhizus]|uniref:FAD/NAD(P)-binding domain-containing protein n=1 Tax=Guyanagaster necrorhizus TaxID=856835 RepID=A0A9P7VQE7_9AGAR|nr:FAD/NAD(P)-binding domain-containing protein [Guyanagaster necrorhizus MCA 3950]KAG7445516.1 FAD/NAD(P)-binding domain-containing protein [Guyanagaster necrorhizus MCA 3950]
MKVAVVGSGVAGLAATWALNEYSNHEVHLYEADERPGGHANTVPFGYKNKDGSRQTVKVDTGFIVLNPSTYPNFLRFLKLHPSVEIMPTEMTFSVTRDNGKFEWAGNNLATLFCQPWRLLDRNMWRMVYDILRFNASARRLVSMWNKQNVDAWEDYSIGEYLEWGSYSDAFRDNYLIPMTAAIWSTPPDKCALDFPARTLIQFMHNHHLLQLTGKPSWLTFRNGSHAYVNAILSKLPSSQLHLAAAVKSIRTGSRIILTTEDGREESYDHVVMACHSDAVLSIIKAGGSMQPKEEEILRMFKWNKNETVLHSDSKLMPRSNIAWSCWNYLTYSTVDRDGERKANVDQVSITYGMNAVQHISKKNVGPVLVTLNPPFEPNPTTVRGRWHYHHPVLDGDALRAQNMMASIQGTRGITYAGAYLNFGFHEDGFTSGLLAVRDLGVCLPFELEFRTKDWTVEWAAAFFDLLQGFGIRYVVGRILGLILGYWLWLLGLCGIEFDF